MPQKSEILRLNLFWPWLSFEIFIYCPCTSLSISHGKNHRCFTAHRVASCKNSFHGCAVFFIHYQCAPFCYFQFWNFLIKNPVGPLSNCKNSVLTKFYERIARKKGKKKAIVATARKMTRVIYWMLKNKEPFHIEGYKPRQIHAK